MIGYRLLPPAEEEMTEAAMFYESASAGIGDDFLDDVQYAINQAREHPAIGQFLQQTLRRIVIRRFPFSVIYSVERDEILVVALAHDRRRPDYWRDRLD